MLDELGILGSATHIVNAVINGQIEGYELKSERDTPSPVHIRLSRSGAETRKAKPMMTASVVSQTGAIRRTRWIR